jgi:hypothetical protein
MSNPNIDATLSDADIQDFKDGLVSEPGAIATGSSAKVSP